MSLETSIKYLTERGVTAKRISQTRYSLHVDGKRGSNLDEVSEGYVFHCWDCVPGPSSDDFEVTFPELDDALLAVWYFYFGESVQVNGWNVPMHRQPHWSLGKVAYRIANAVHVNCPQFKAIEESRAANSVVLSSPVGGRPRSEGRYAIALRSQFIACPAASKDARTLVLRRDLEEAYVVGDPR
ncbi:hypothetical protein OU995_13750 [Roseateles sp. SL47]|uniref:hypothetical protein n=1 Tax=Roseateles sp. SL47 TaxID=2995138 RepID=UPI00226E8470|nr:hypothetical protein [Roseateles sp. SL47]WAC75689.1 hypothetical protein OU995_13750 [Roseateles sp. SL47]